MEVTMNLAQELHQVVAEVLAGNYSPDDLHDWLVNNVQAVADADDQDLRRVVDRAWILLDEWYDEVREEASLRNALSDLIRVQPSAPVVGGPVASPVE
jgi:hypothetical protein